MFVKKIFIFFVLFFILNNFAKSQDIFIVAKVDKEIITNIDIELEKNYLLLLNNKLNKISKNEFFKLAKNSLIREIIKKKEIKKSFKKPNKEFKDKITKRFYNKFGFENKNDFINFLKTKNINFENLKEKLIVEAFWNQLIFIKYNNKIRIDESSIKNDVIKYFNSRDKKYEFNLSEIIIDIDNDINLKKNEILKYVKEFGFKVAANKYSKSDTSKYGGEIGWIKSSRLTKSIQDHISNIKIGETTEPIQTSNGYLFLKLNDKREIKEEIDLEKELKQQIEFEKNRQLNQFSLIYYKKVKKNTNIYESK